MRPTPRRRRWRLPLVIAGVTLVVLAAAGWHDLRTARAQLLGARSALQLLVDDPGALRTPAGRAEARTATADARRSVVAAGRRLERSVPLRIAGALPGLSRQRTGALDVVVDARAGSDVGLRLLGSLDRLAEQDQLRAAAVPLEGLGRLQAEVVGAAARLTATARSDAGLWGPLGSARRDLNRTAVATARRMGEAADGISAASGFLGADRPRRYLLAVQNNAEMRAQGMVLSFAFVGIDGGRLRVERSGPITDLALDRPVDVPVPSGMEQVFGGLAPSRLWHSVNATADFAWSGRVMAAMAEQATGQGVDGVIAIDINGLAAVLRVVGPVAVDGIPEPVDATNAAEILLNRLYADFPRQHDQGERKERLGLVVQALVARLVGGSFDAVHLGSELAAVAEGGHLRLWSAEPAEQAAFERSGLGGGPGVRAPERTFHVSVQNATATKLDFFVRPRVDMAVSLTPSGAAVVHTTVVVANTAPENPPDSYQFGPDGFGQASAGQYIARVYLWSPRGARQEGGVVESGLVVNQGPTTVAPGEERVVRFQTVIPRAVRSGRLDLRLVPQPRLHPVKLHVTLSAPGWEVRGPTTLDVDWDHVVTTPWVVRR